MPHLPAQPAFLNSSSPAVNPSRQSVERAFIQPDDSAPPVLELDVLSLNTFALPAPLGKNIAARSERIGRSLGEYEIVEQAFKPFTYASHADALAQKGVSFTRVRLPEGQMLDVYNTHFQAMRDKADAPHEKLGLKIMGLLFSGYAMPRDEIRAHDAEILKAFVEEHDAGHPVIITGDFNTQESDALYGVLKDSLGLNDAFRELHPEDPGYTSDGKTNPYKSNPQKRKRVDYIFYRDGQHLDLKPIKSQVVFDKPVDGLFVSDHYGVHTRFQLFPKATP